ncbi:AAA family ATPase, partial [bacterium LRH843]|nr:AAA family ATPase [bacterium LRH843]
SMVDAPFFLKILKHAKPRSRIIFLGDPNQLPPVGVGTIFQELLEKCSTKATLTVCQRTDLKHILQSADLVRNGSAKEYIERFYPSTTKVLPPHKE